MNPASAPASLSSAVLPRASLPFLPHLDLVRAAAITMVVAFHYLTVQFRFPLFGWIGVWLFFVLSGFLIGRALLADRSRPLRAYLVQFYWRRGLRILPLYLAYLAGAALLEPVFELPPVHFSWALTFTENIDNWYNALGSPFFDHLWSLSAEEQFYLLFPFLVWALPRRALGVVLVAVIAAVPAVREAALLLGVPGLDHFIKVFPGLQFDAFAAGALIAVAEPLLLDAPAGFVVAGAAILLVPSTALALLLGRAGDEVLFFSAVVLCCALAVAMAHRLPVPAWRPVRLAHRIGRVSYGLYLFHMPLVAAVLHFTRALPRPLFAVGFFAVFALSYAFAEVSYRYFERGFLALKAVPAGISVHWRSRRPALTSSETPRLTNP